jgi:putative methionine-R-sulfoxide reductase with GAF domain/GNAT superfamily N-acetyltransferase
MGTIQHRGCDIGEGLAVVSLALGIVRGPVPGGVAVGGGVPGGVGSTDVEGSAEVGALGPAEVAGNLGALAALLLDCISSGSPAGFVGASSASEARAAFHLAADDVASGRAFILAAFVGDELLGIVQVEYSSRANQPHRAEVVRHLVHPKARGGGLGRLLLRRAEAHARAEGKVLLVVTTASREAGRLYESLGWKVAGEVPNDTVGWDGELCSTVVFYKQLLQQDQVALLTKVVALSRSKGPRPERAKGVAELVRAGTRRRWVGIYELRANEVVNLAWSGPSEPAHMRFPATMGLTGAAIATKAPVVCNDVSADPRYLTAFTSTASEMIVPVVMEGQVVGTLDVEDQRRDAFYTNDQDLFEALAAAVRPLFP